MKYSKKNHIICFDRDELEVLFRKEMLMALGAELKKRELRVGDLRDRKDLMHAISSHESRKLSKDNDRIEIFAAWNIFLDFYAKDASACFELNPGFDILKEKIETLLVLKKATRKNTLTDFAILSDGCLRKFQLKRYQGPINEDSVFSFVVKKIKEYGNDIGDTNLIVILQPEIPVDISVVGFKSLHKRLSGAGYTFGGEILITYNEENNFTVINQVYPKLTTSRVLINWRDPESVPRVKRK